jgi:hypothetical protein
MTRLGSLGCVDSTKANTLGSSYETRGVRMIPAPEGGPTFVTEKSSLEVREEVVDTDRLRSLRDELDEVQKREEEIKREMKELPR